MIHAPLTITVATLEDAESLAAMRMALECENAAFGDMMSEPRPFEEQHQRREAEDILLDNNQIVFMAKRGPVSVGYAHVRTGRLLGNGKGLVLSGFYISPQHRGSGICIALVRRVVQVALAYQPDVGQSVVFNNNRMVAGFLERLGFRAIATVYHREVDYGGHDFGAEAVEQVHEERGQHAPRREVRPDPEPPVSGRPGARFSVPR